MPEIRPDDWRAWATGTLKEVLFIIFAVALYHVLPAGVQTSIYQLTIITVAACLLFFVVLGLMLVAIFWFDNCRGGV